MDENKVMTEEELEEIIMQIIVNSGASRSLAIEALRAAGEGNFEEADEKMKQADETILETHEYQTSLIQDEINGKHVPLNLLMVHAQDHLMNAMTVMDLAKEIIAIKKEGHK